MTDLLRSATDAVAAACRAARLVQQDLARVQAITKDDRSPVTVADYAVQAIVALDLRGDGDEALIVGEEHAGALRDAGNATVREAVVDVVRQVHPGISTDEVLDAIDACDHDGTAAAYWTLDPIDGTKGFLRGQQYAVALGRIEDGRVVLGAMGCPNLPRAFDRPFDVPDATGAIYVAQRGAGAHELAADDPHGAGRPIRAAGSDEDTLCICGSVEAAHSRHSDTERVAAHLGLRVTYARLDSQCKYALVARGQADAYLRMPTRKDYVEKIWDHAAGSIIATEAGAVVSDISGSTLDFSRGRRLECNRGIVCAAERVHRRIIAAIEELGIAAAV